MILKWNKDNMEKNMKNLLLKERLNYFDKCNYEFYDNYLNDRKVDEEYMINLTDEEILQELENMRNDYISFLAGLPPKLLKNYANMIEGLKFISVDNEDILMKQKNMSNQDLFDNSYSIYGSISPYLTKCLDYIYKNNLIYRDNILGRPVCYNDIYNKQGYVYFPKAIDCSQESAFNHEIAHSIIANINGEFFYEKHPGLAEFHSIFMEIYTDKYLYEKTKDVYYLTSLYNTFAAYKSIITSVGVINEISKINGELTVSNVLNQVVDNYGLVVDDFNSWFNDFLEDYDMLEHFDYLVSCCYALSVFNKEDKEQIRRTFIDSCFNDFSNIIEFNKLVGINLNDEFCLCDLFNTESSKIKQMVRRLK